MPNLPRPSAHRIWANMLAAGLLSLVPTAATYGQETPLSVAITPGLESDSAYVYADLVDLATAPQKSPCGRRCAKQCGLGPSESPGLAAGRVRLYIEARTSALLIGPDLGESIRFLADVPLDTPGQGSQADQDAKSLCSPAPCPIGPASSQLVAPDAMLPLTPGREATLRAILTETTRPDAPARHHRTARGASCFGQSGGRRRNAVVSGHRATAAPVSISVLRRPGSLRPGG